MRGLLLAGVLGLVVGLAPAQDSPFPKRPEVPKVLPDTPKVVVGPLKLSGDLQYVVNSKTPGVLRPHPANLVRVTAEKGPIRIRGKFVDGSGLTESRDYAGPYVWILEPAGKGTVELDLIPFGLKAEKEILTDSFSVDDGFTPGPDVKPDVVPEPDKPAPIPEEGFRILIVYERDTFLDLPGKQQEIVDGQKFRDFVDANCVKVGMQPEYRFYDQNVVLTAESEIWKKAMARERKTIPWIVISNGKTGTEEALPADTDAAIKLASKYLPKTGGK